VRASSDETWASRIGALSRFSRLSSTCAIVRVSLDQASSTVAAEVLARHGITWKGTSLYESESTAGSPEILAAMLDAIAAIDPAQLDYLWLYVDQASGPVEPIKR
jgi:hypothetical protein